MESSGNLNLKNALTGNLKQKIKLKTVVTANWK